MSANRRFELMRELGSGTFGTVYLAELVSQGGFRKRVALKVLNPQWDAGSDAARRLRDEARLLGRLNHRHIVRVDDLVRLGGRWGVVMEYVPGSDLEKVIEACRRLGTQVPVGATLGIVAAVGQALDVALHGTTENGDPLSVVHRDIKPGNIRLSPEGDVKVLDFGIAYATFDEREAKTEQVRYGSVAYMAPERLLGEPEVSAGDVYAMGCVMYEMLAAEPFGRAELAPERHAARVEEALSALQGSRGKGLEDISNLMRAALAYDVGDRPSAADLAKRALSLQRIGDDADLTAFAQSIVPKVPELLGEQSRKVDGVLSEETWSFGSSGGVPVASNPTILAPDADFDAGPSEAAGGAKNATGFGGTPTSAETNSQLPQGTDSAPFVATRRRGLVGAGAVLAGLLTVVGIAAWYGSRAPGPGGSPTGTALPDVVEATPGAPAGGVAVPGVAVDDGPEGSAEGTADVGTAAAGPASPSSAEPDAGTAAGTAGAPEAAPSAPTGRPPAPSTKAKSSSRRNTTEATTSSDNTAQEPAVDSAGATIRSVKFAAPAAESVRALCGDQQGSGPQSALVRNLEPGSCVVTVAQDGRSFTTTVDVKVGRGFTCSVEGGALQCR